MPPVVVLTSNRTRDVHDALKRRCLYHWVEHPDFEREVAIVRLRAPEVPETLARQVAAAVEALRELELYKPPGVAETIDWAQALAALGRADARRARGRRHPRHGPQVPRGPGAGARRTGIGELVAHRGRRAVPDATERRPTSTGWRSRSPGVLRGAGLDVPVGSDASPSPRRSARSASTSRDAGVLGRPGHARAPARGHRRSTTARSPRSGGSAARARDRAGRRSSVTSLAFDTDATTTPPSADEAGDDADGADARRCARARPRCCATSDFAAYTPAEFAEARRLMADLRLAGALRRSRRAAPVAASRGPARPAPHRARARCAPAASRSDRAFVEPADAAPAARAAAAT